MKRRRAHHTDSSSRIGSSSSSSSSDSSSSSRNRHRHHHRRRRSSTFSDPPFISCSATPAKYLLKRIRRGKFVTFDKLLLPVLDETLVVGQAAKRTRDSRSAKRRVVDLATWLEAWNIFLAVRLQVSPSSALQLAKYQAIMCQLFSSYPVGVCIKYDSLFRQAVARDKSHLTPWGQVKDDILLWCAIRTPFGPPSSLAPTPCNPPPPMEQPSLPKGVSPTHSQGRKSAGNSITPPAIVPSVPLPTSAGSRVASVTTPASPALELLQLQGKLHPYTPLRCSVFERSLSDHPDKAWVSWLLHSIKHGISIGFNGARTPLKSHNLISAYQHPDIISSELSKEIAAGRVLGPFTEKPFVNLQTSGLGAAPKKNGKWRVILHLSALASVSTTGSQRRSFHSITLLLMMLSAASQAWRWLSHGKSRPKVSLSHGSSPGRGLGSLGYVLAREVLCRHMSTVWPAISSILIKSVC